MARIKEINAVHEKDLEDFLNSIGMLDKVKAGQINCFVCGQTITLENIECIIPLKDKINFCCHKQECYYKALELLKE